MSKKQILSRTAIVITLTVVAVGALGAYLGGDFDLSWYTIDGGGGSNSTGGEFSLSGTIGQPDAGRMAGGEYALTGGFWPIPAAVPEGCVRDPDWICDGDVDGDGQVNPVDSGLVQASFGSTDEQLLCQYDVDCDGQINPVDSGIVQSLFGTCDPPRDGCP